MPTTQPKRPVLYLVGEDTAIFTSEDTVDDPYRLHIDPKASRSASEEVLAIKWTEEDRNTPSLRIGWPQRRTGRTLAGLALDRAVEPDADVESLPPQSTAARSGYRTAIHERIASEQRIKNLAEALVRHRWRGLLRSNRMAAMPITATDYQVERSWLGWELETPEIVPSAPFMLEMAGYNSIFQFLAESVETIGNILYVPLPQEVVRLRRRWRRRAPAPPEFGLRFRPRGTNERFTWRPLIDLSYNGVSFWTEADRDNLGVDTELELEIEIPRTRPIRLVGAVRHLTGPSHARMRSCGVLLRNCAADELARWAMIVEKVFYPATSRGSLWSEATWRLYERAGYFGLSGKDPAQFQALRAAFHSVAGKLEATPQLGCQVAWPMADKEVLATLSVLRLYHGTWLGYQMAKTKGDAPDGTPGIAVLRDIHLHAYEHAQNDPDLRWIVGYTQVKRVWSRVVHHDLPRRYTEAGLASIVRFRALEVSALAPAAGAELTPHGFSVVSPERGELTACLQTLEQSLPRPYFDAFDFAPAHFDLSHEKRLWSKAGLLRDRAALVARRNGEPVALAILEVAADGLHLFRLLDSVRLYALAPGGEQGFVPLLEAAKSWYLSYNKKVFTCFLDLVQPLPLSLTSGLTDLGLADMNILSAELLPELLEHLCEHTAPPTTAVAID